MNIKEIEDNLKKILWRNTDMDKDRKCFLVSSDIWKILKNSWKMSAHITGNEMYYGKKRIFYFKYLDYPIYKYAQIPKYMYGFIIFGKIYPVNTVV